MSVAGRLERWIGDDSFVTPDYIEVTAALGTEITKALNGTKTAAQAIKDASDQVTAIVKKRA